MDLIQKISVVVLLSLLMYFVAVNLLEDKISFRTDGSIGSIENLNIEVDKHTKTILGDPAPAGGENITQLAVFNEHNKGVLPSNHDLFETKAEFESDVTNINQFYKNNPELFNKPITTSPDGELWNKQSQELYNNIVTQPTNEIIKPSNFEFNI